MLVNSLTKNLSPSSQNSIHNCWCTVTKKTTMMRENLRCAYKEELLFYRSHHQNKVNWYIHRFCIPLEWLSWFTFSSFVLSPVVIASVVAIYYLVIGSPASCRAALLTLMLGCIALVVNKSTITAYACILAFLLQITAWVVQVRIGHYYFEKNSPGMLKKLTFNSAVLSLLMVSEEMSLEKIKC